MIDEGQSSFFKMPSDTFRSTLRFYRAEKVHVAQFARYGLADSASTLCPKKRSHFYFLNNSVKNEPILIVFGILNPEET